MVIPMQQETHYKVPLGEVHVIVTDDLNFFEKQCIELKNQETTKDMKILLFQKEENEIYAVFSGKHTEACVLSFRNSGFETTFQNGYGKIQFKKKKEKKKRKMKNKQYYLLEDITLENVLSSLLQTIINIHESEMRNISLDTYGIFFGI